MLHEWPPPIVADLSPIDAAAWRGVVRGLSLVRVGLWLVFFGPLGTCCCCVPIGHFLMDAASWMQAILLLFVACLNLCSPVTVVVGLAFCCQAPAESGALRYAKATLVLTLTLICFVLLLFGLSVMTQILPQWTAWGRDLTSQNLFALILSIMLLLNFSFAVYCWQLFLECVSDYLTGWRRLAAEARKYRWWFTAWAGTSAIFLILRLQWNLNEVSGLPAICGVFSVFGAPVLYVWQIVLIQQIEDSISIEVGRTPAGNAQGAEGSGARKS